MLKDQAAKDKCKFSWWSLINAHLLPMTLDVKM